MSDTPTAASEPSEEFATEAAARPKRSPARRLGCALLLVAWFAFLLTPCAFFYLAANGEIRLEHADIPQPHAHPRLLIALVSEPDARGLRIERASIARGALDDARVCVETAVNFLLWHSGEASQDVRYCDCYQRRDSAAAWTFSDTYSHSCATVD